MKKHTDLSRRSFLGTAAASSRACATNAGLQPPLSPVFAAVSYAFCASAMRPALV